MGKVKDDTIDDRIWLVFTFRDRKDKSESDEGVYRCFPE